MEDTHLRSHHACIGTASLISTGWNQDGSNEKELGSFPHRYRLSLSLSVCHCPSLLHAPNCSLSFSVDDFSIDKVY